MILDNQKFLSLEKCDFSNLVNTFLVFLHVFLSLELSFLYFLDIALEFFLNIKYSLNSWNQKKNTEVEHRIEYAGI